MITMQASISTGERTKLPSGREMAMRSALLNGDFDALDAVVQKRQPNCSQLEKILYCESEEEALEIIQSGCDISASIPNHSYKTLLHLTIAMDHLNITRLLLENGADVDAKDRFGFTPLHVAVQNDKYEAACMLLCYGASANEQDFLVQGTPLLQAMNHSDNHRYVELLLDYTSYVTTVNFAGYSILHFAVLNYNQLLPKILALYEDVNDIEDIFGVLRVSLNENPEMISPEDCYLFKHVFSHVNEDKLVQEYATILNDLICARIKRKEDFMECFYLVLSLDPLTCVSRLVENCSFIPLIEKFDFYKVNQSDRMSCLYSLLAVGKDIDYDEFNRIYWQYGFNEELEAIFKTRPHINTNTSQAVPHRNYDCIDMASIIFYNYRVVTNGQILLTLIQTINQAVVKDYLRFFRIRNAHDISNPLDLPERVQKLVRKLKEQSVPSLREMSRNLIRETIISNSPQYDTPSCTCMYDVYDAIKTLPVPKVIQDILHLKRPLYI